jgi:hypothetical protein
MGAIEIFYLLKIGVVPSASAWMRRTVTIACASAD